MAVGAACWIVSAIDAARAALRETAKARARRVSFAPLVTPDRERHGLDAGLSVAW